MSAGKGGREATKNTPYIISNAHESTNAMFSLYNFAFAFSICCKESLRLFDLQLSPKLLTGLYVSDCVRSLIDKKMDNIILCDAKIIRTMHRAEAELSRADHNWRAGGWDEV